ncbi:MAG: PEP-CTERM sorting domain-containing protein [Kiritimatiellia bacterium]
MKMKKILFTLLAAVAVSITASASAVDWSFTTKNTSTGVVGGMAYLVLGDATTFDSISALAAVAKDSAAILTSGSKLVTNKQTWNEGTASVGATDTFSIVLVDSENKGYYIAATGLVGTYYDPADLVTAPPAAIGKTVSTAITAASMTSFSGGDVPEPTSGILLLVGGAMLALRRKQK